MKSLFVILFAALTISITAGNIVNPDKPQNGVWDFNLNKVWAVESGGEELLIRVGQIRTDSDGNVYVMERKHGKIFKFDKNGKFVTTIGKRGEGPGEFRMAFSFFIVGDNIIVPSMGGMFQYFGKDGEFRKQVNTGSFVFPRYYLNKDSFVWVKSDSEGRGKKPEMISIYDMNTKKSEDIKTISPEELLTAQKGGMVLMIKDSQTTAGVVLALQGKDIIYGKSDKYKFMKIDLKGKELSSFSLDGRKRKSISEKFKRKRFENISLNGGRMPKDMIDQMIKGMPDIATYFSRIFIGKNGLIYIFVSDLENEDGQGVDIFSPEGKYLYHGEIKVEEGSKIRSPIAFYKNSIYMFVEDEEGESSLIKYKIDLPE